MYQRIKKMLFSKEWRAIYFDKLNLRKLSDKEYLENMSVIQLGKKFDLDHPKSFNEKLNWLKLYDRKLVYTDMVDKQKAKSYVENLIGKKYIIPTYEIWNTPEEIHFDHLPKQFVLKCTHDSGGLIIVRDKDKVNIDGIKNKLSKFYNKNYYNQFKEWPYKNVKPRIIAEQYVEGLSNTMIDYKFYCFNGEPQFLYVSEGLENHETACINYLTLDWNLAPFQRPDYKQFSKLPKCPSKFDEMLEISRKLSANTNFLRVDLYQVQDNVLFSELTFSPCAGFNKFCPEEYDRKLGDLLDIHDKYLI